MSRRHDGDEEWDVGGLLALLVLLVLLCAAGLATMPGNRFMCRKAIAPTFIDCAKVK